MLSNFSMNMFGLGGLGSNTPKLNSTKTTNVFATIIGPVPTATPVNIIVQATELALEQTDEGPTDVPTNTTTQGYDTQGDEGDMDESSPRTPTNTHSEAALNSATQNSATQNSATQNSSSDASDSAIIACHCSMQGWRKTMEDDFAFVTNLRATAAEDRRGFSRQSSTKSSEHSQDGSLKSPVSPRKTRTSTSCTPIFVETTQASALEDAAAAGASPLNDMFLSVFDGHGGSDVSKFVAKEIVGEFNKCEYLQRYNFNKSSSKIGARSHEERSDPDLILEGITTAYLNTDKMLQQATSTNATPGSGFRLKQFDQMGSTAVSCYINEVDMCVAWLGDSRAVLCRSGLAVAMTTDHKPNDATEAARIAKAGGEVMRGRVNGQLAVSRSFGDFYYKTPPESPPEEQMVSASPDTMSMPRDLINDEFLILACDGVWDAITNQDACYIIGELIARKVPVETICQKFMDYCLIANSRDNMTVIIALFPASKRLQPKAYLNAGGFGTATNSKPDIGVLNSHAHKSKLPNGGFQVRRASITLFNELKEADGHIKIATGAAIHADEILGLTKDTVSSWTEDEVVEGFLKKLDMMEYEQFFREEGVDGKLLLELTQLEFEDDLMMNPLDARFLKMGTTYVVQKGA